jgi:3-hydroxy-9,10-secoandrosta-1,3,5(10)-triene-9,17-dione monooxygenase reductase component
MTGRISMSTIDPIQLRNAFGSFITGVTIITGRAPDGTPVGMTANSFSSVSLDPPLALWSVAKTATAFEVFQACSHFTIHVLHSGQEALSRQFASKNTDRFADTVHELGAGDVPVLTDYSARFECEVEHRYPGGDHIILVGRILAFDNRDKEPLVFYKGQYKQLAK